ncbi:MAG: FeoB-associated Cys-rich membrane protein [Fastidiosipila sp.]|nr:FeoB-associated Cys-rich membrane protein [Fastidiosipila sp.]
MWETIVAVVVVALIVAAAIVKIVRDKKKGTKCIGCPVAQNCAREVKKACNTGSDQKIKEESN